jgi:hypothetical protein
MERKTRQLYQVKNGNVILGYIVILGFEFGSQLISQILELLILDGK